MKQNFSAALSPTARGFYVRSIPALVSIFACVMTTLPAAAVRNSIRDSVRQKIIAAGVNPESLERILKYIEKNAGQEETQEAYICKNPPPAPPKSRKPDSKRPKHGSDDDKKPNTTASSAATPTPSPTPNASPTPAPTPVPPSLDDLRSCDESLRIKIMRKVKIGRPRYVVSVDFSKPSTENRFFVIDLQTGDVEKHLSTHGRGSGRGRWAYKFSNIKDTEQSSLGLYITGQTYRGHHGDTLRLYGLERSNDQAYNRDIVVHPAAYATADFMKQISPRTKKPIGRLGLSWGCPAISPDAFKNLLPKLRGGAIMDLYHPDLMERALSGHEVSVPEPVNAPAPTPVPTPSPQATPEPNGGAGTSPQTPSADPAPKPTPTSDAKPAATPIEDEGADEDQRDETNGGSSHRSGHPARGSAHGAYHHDR